MVSGPIILTICMLGCVGRPALSLLQNPEEEQQLREHLLNLVRPHHGKLRIPLPAYHSWRQYLQPSDAEDTVLKVLEPNG